MAQGVVQTENSWFKQKHLSSGGWAEEFHSEGYNACIEKG